jgi:hypothetical protein
LWLARWIWLWNRRFARASASGSSRSAVGLHHVAQDLNLLLRGVLGGELGGQPLQLLPHDVKLGHLRVVERGHDQRPAVAGQQALRLQPLQRLADRRAADPEPVGQFAFHQPVAGAVDALVDRVEDKVVGIPMSVGLGGHVRYPFVC